MNGYLDNSGPELDKNGFHKVTLTNRSALAMLGACLAPTALFMWWIISTSFSGGTNYQKSMDQANRNTDAITAITAQLAILTANVQTLTSRVQDNENHLKIHDEAIGGEEDYQKTLQVWLEDWWRNHQTPAQPRDMFDPPSKPRGHRRP
jgi:hypothetical protein